MEEVRVTRSRLESRLDEKEKENTKLMETIKEVQDEVFILTREKKELETEKLEAEEVCDGFKDEADKALGGYNKLKEDFNKVSQERDEWRKKRDATLNTLSVRNEEIAKKDKELEEVKMRMKRLQKERDNCMEKNMLMDAQLAGYKEDFDSERKAREREAKKMNELHARVNSLERDKKELREQLNRYAASQFQQDFEEVIIVVMPAIYDGIFFVLELCTE